MEPLVRLLPGAAKTICLACFAGFCVLTLAQVVNRYALGWPMYWTEEVALLLFVWSVMMGLPVALWHGQEIVVDILGLPPGRAATLMSSGAHIVSVVFLLLLAWSGWQLIDRAGAALSPALGLPRWISYAAIPVGSLFGVLALVTRRFTLASGPASAESNDAAYTHD